MAITGIGEVKREEFMLFMDISDNGSPIWELLGDDIEDMSIALNPNIITRTDVTGKTKTKLDKYEEQTDVTPMRVKRESGVFQTIYEIVRDKKTLSDVVHKFLVVNLFDDLGNGSYGAWIQDGVVAVQSYGGDAEGLDIPFNIHWMGARTHGGFNPDTGIFTPSTGALYLVTFSVKDGSNNKLADAYIYINGKALRTNALGFASINLPAGEHDYTVSKVGFNPETDSITITNEAILEEITLTA